jgi:hypothetical protein
MFIDFSFYLNFFKNLSIHEIYSAFFYFFTILNLLLIAGHIIFIPRLYKFRPNYYKETGIILKENIFLKMDKMEKKNLVLEWETIKQKTFLSPPGSFSLGIIAADNFVDQILLRLGLRGKHIADRIEELGLLNLKSYDELLYAHRMKNEIARNEDLILSSKEAEEIIGKYEKFLIEIGVID